jgi:hypothetical protein
VTRPLACPVRVSVVLSFSLQVDRPEEYLQQNSGKGTLRFLCTFLGLATFAVWLHCPRCRRKLGDRRQQRQISEQGLAVARGRLGVRRDPSSQRRDPSLLNMDGMMRTGAGDCVRRNHHQRCGPPGGLPRRLPPTPNASRHYIRRLAAPALRTKSPGRCFLRVA